MAPGGGFLRLRHVPDEAPGMTAIIIAGIAAYAAFLALISCICIAAGRAGAIADEQARSLMGAPEGADLIHNGSGR